MSTLELDVTTNTKISRGNCQMIMRSNDQLILRQANQENIKDLHYLSDRLDLPDSSDIIKFNYNRENR